MNKKMCFKCQKTKDFSEFNKDKTTTTGLRVYCRECEKIERRKQYLKNREKRIASATAWKYKNMERNLKYQQEYRQRWKMEVIKNYGGQCVCCGEKIPEFLTVEHINGGGRKHRKHIGSFGVYREIVRKKYPKEYTVLCMNCNFARRFGKKCPHEALQQAEEL